jgi:hypothetical protein
VGLGTHVIEPVITRHVSSARIAIKAAAYRGFDDSVHDSDAAIESVVLDEQKLLGAEVGIVSP